MILNREKRKKRRAQTDEAIHIVALWNLMLILIPFLLLSAAFSETSILNLMIPSTAAAAPPIKKELEPPKKEPIQLTLKMNGFALAQGVSRNRSIPFRSGLYDYPALRGALEEFKQANTEEETIVLSGSSKVSYETIVQAMDQCREAGFPNILLGADSSGENL
jgi:biopolymer transport protein ExbD